MGTHSEGLDTSAGWVTGHPHPTQVSILGLSYHIRYTGVHVGLVPPVQQIEAILICFADSTG